MKCTHLGKEYDSITEACMAAWCSEASALNILDDYYEQVPYTLSHTATHHVEKQLKTKVKLVERTLLQRCEYTADFVLAVHEAQIRYALRDAGLLESNAGCVCNEYSDAPYAMYVVDVKGERQPATQAAKFSVTQKFLYYSQGIYVNKLVPCARKPKARAGSFFMLCGLPSELPQECYLKDGADFRQPWRDMFDGCPGIEEALGERLH